MNYRLLLYFIFFVGINSQAMESVFHEFTSSPAKLAEIYEEADIVPSIDCEHCNKKFSNYESFKTHHISKYGTRAGNCNDDICNVKTDYFSKEYSAFQLTLQKEKADITSEKKQLSKQTRKTNRANYAWLKGYKPCISSQKRKYDQFNKQLLQQLLHIEGQQTSIAAQPKKFKDQITTQKKS